MIWGPLEASAGALCPSLSLPVLLAVLSMSSEPEYSFVLLLQHRAW